MWAANLTILRKSVLTEWSLDSGFIITGFDSSQSIENCNQSSEGGCLSINQRLHILTSWGDRFRAKVPRICIRQTSKWFSSYSTGPEDKSEHFIRVSTHLNTWNFIFFECRLFSAWWLVSIKYWQQLYNEQVRYPVRHWRVHKAVYMKIRTTNLISSYFFDRPQKVIFEN